VATGLPSSRGCILDNLLKQYLGGGVGSKPKVSGAGTSDQELSPICTENWLSAYKSELATTPAPLSFNCLIACMSLMAKGSDTRFIL
jgi:hypothetical protein